MVSERVLAHKRLGRARGTVRPVPLTYFWMRPFRSRPRTCPQVIATLSGMFRHSRVLSVLRKIVMAARLRDPLPEPHVKLFLIASATRRVLPGMTVSPRRRGEQDPPALRSHARDNAGYGSERARTVPVDNWAEAQGHPYR
jgi:hypothetical protein